MKLAPTSWSNNPETPGSNSHFVFSIRQSVKFQILSTTLPTKQPIHTRCSRNVSHCSVQSCLIEHSGCAHAWHHQTGFELRARIVQRMIEQHSPASDRNFSVYSRVKLSSLFGSVIPVALERGVSAPLAPPKLRSFTSFFLCVWSPVQVQGTTVVSDHTHEELDFFLMTRSHAKLTRLIRNLFFGYSSTCSGASHVLRRRNHHRARSLPHRSLCCKNTLAQQPLVQTELQASQQAPR